MKRQILYSSKTDSRDPFKGERKLRVSARDRDEISMNLKIPLVQRIKEKESNALGRTHPNSSFTNELIRLDEPTSEILMSFSSIFPFDFFPNSIVIDPIQVKVTNRYFFFSKQIQSVLIKDILKTFTEEGPFMATLKIVTRDERENPLSIHYLRKEEANMARKIIQGLMISRSESADVSKLESIR